jgi:hypothetical protein
VYCITRCVFLSHAFYNPPSLPCFSRAFSTTSERACFNPRTSHPTVVSHSSTTSMAKLFLTNASSQKPSRHSPGQRRCGRRWWATTHAGQWGSEGQRARGQRGHRVVMGESWMGGSGLSHMQDCGRWSKGQGIIGMRGHTGHRSRGQR